METMLSAHEARVLGSLIEKELTTPEYYPLTINSLTAACNQKSNRDPVMTLSENDVRKAMDLLRGKTLAWEMNLTGSRVPKYEHNLPAKFGFTQQESSVLCVLMLRGPATPGEIRGCTGRMYAFKDPAEVEETLRNLTEKENGPFVAKLPVLPGKKEHRYAHLFSGEPPSMPAGASYVESAPSGQSPDDRIVALEERITLIAEELVEMKQAFEAFKKSFE
jgi:uncharacterized protein YceH (UPF0502 family)